MISEKTFYRQRVIYPRRLIMVAVTVAEMFEAGAHFGHQTKKWNPRMKPYLYGARSGIHIIDLQQTQALAQTALNFIEKIVGEGQDVLFVGTKMQAQSVLEEEAKRCNMPYMTRRWLGGTLTNFGTIKKSIDRMLELEGRREKNDFVGFTKKELLTVDRQIAKLDEALGGIRSMKKPPGLLFIVDPSLEKIAVHEANVLQIPIVAMTDSNCDPDPIDYLVPANDDALRSIQLLASKVAEACLAGMERREQMAREEGTKRANEEKKRSSRQAKEIGASGTAFVSKAETYDAGVEVESFSASVVTEEPVSLADELNKEEVKE